MPTSIVVHRIATLYFRKKENCFLVVDAWRFEANNIFICHDHPSSYAFYVYISTTCCKKLITQIDFKLFMLFLPLVVSNLWKLSETYLIRLLVAINNRLTKSFITNLLTDFSFNLFFDAACYSIARSIANLLTSQSICSIIYIQVARVCFLR